MSTTVTYKGSTLTTVDNQTRTLKTAGKYMEGDVVLTDVTSGGTTINNQNKTVTPSESIQSITADSGYTGLGTVTVNGIPFDYVGSGIDQLDSSDLTVSGATVTAPAGYYSAQASKAVASGTAGTPTATKGTVSNHSISVTPSVTNTAGYIAGGTETGTAVTVSASELVSGSETKTSNGTYDVTNLAELIVNVSGGTSWQTLYDGSAQVYSSSPNYFQISPYTTAFQSDQTYRVTWGQTQYLCNTIADPLGATYDGWLIGNLSIVGAGTDTGEPFIIYRNSATELTGGTTSSAGTASLKIELQQNSSSPELQSKTVTPTESQQTVQADSGYDGLDTVTVNAISSTYVGSGIARKSSTDLTVSGATVTAPAGYYSAAASKSVASGSIRQNGWSETETETSISMSPKLEFTEGYITNAPLITRIFTKQEETVTPSLSQQVINQNNNAMLTKVTVEAMPSGTTTAPASISGTAASVSTGNGTLTLTKTVSVTPSVTAGYVSSGTAGNSSVSLTASVTIDPTPTASGATVTIPAGYYSAQTTKSVTTMTLPTSAASSATSGYTKKATISRSTSTQYINIAPGYNSAGGYYEISAVANGSATGPSSLSGSSATVSTGTNTLTLTKTGVTTTPTVTAGYVSSATASTATVTLTASVTTKAAATITPTTTNQTIAAGTYLTGTQTIAGDADLVGSNILSTANIFGVQGTVDFIDVYIRSTAPTSSVGSDGDIYIQE